MQLGEQFNETERITMNSKEIIDSIIRPENLFWAWQKVKNYYSTEAAWRDEIEISRFEINLRNELNSIAESFVTGIYTQSLIRPIPQPKKKNGEGIPELRQLFWIPVKYQVAWISVINIIGPIIDSTMPTWSFGNRLYRARWSVEEEINSKVIKTPKFGPYRHTNGMLYKRFSESWPRYRRSIYLTLRKMAHKDHKDFYFELEESEQHLMDLEENSDDLMSL